MRTIQIVDLLPPDTFFNGELSISPFRYNLEEVLRDSSCYEMDFSEIKGQEYVKRALEIAVPSRTTYLCCARNMTYQFELVKPLVRA